jgi:hypothetical protein
MSVTPPPTHHLEVASRAHALPICIAGRQPKDAQRGGLVARSPETTVRSQGCGRVEHPPMGRHTSERRVCCAVRDQHQGAKQAERPRSRLPQPLPHQPAAADFRQTLPDRRERLSARRQQAHCDLPHAEQRTARRRSHSHTPTAMTPPPAAVPIAGQSPTPSQVAARPASTPAPAVAKPASNGRQHTRQAVPSTD